MNGPSASDVARLLGQQALSMCEELLSNGHREGAEWVVGSIANTRGSSMRVHLTGVKAGIWKDFAGGRGGDMLHLVAAVCYAGDLRAAYAWACQRLGLSSGRLAATHLAADPPAIDDTAAKAEAEKKRRSAMALWLDAQPSLVGTPADAYLRGRGIDLAQLGRQPGALRFHPACWCAEAGAKLPAMAAAVCVHEDGGERHVSTHRTWLQQTSPGCWDKARVATPKKVLGSPRGGTIRLWRGASGKPLAGAPHGDTALLGEGIETCLSAALACPEYRVLCATSLANMASVILPPAIGSIIILADNDPPDSEAARSLQRAIDALIGRGHQVRVARSSVGKDFNDALRNAAA